MALRGDQGSQVVHRHRDPLLADAAPNADPVHGRLHLPCARYLPHQHLPTWDEWSSPGDLIHPGDWPSISSNTSSATNAVYRWGTRNGIRVVGRDLAACLWRRRHGANRGAVSRSPGCRKGLRGQHHIHLWLPGACGSKCRGMPRGVMRSRSRLSWGRWWPVTFPGRVPDPTRCRRCLAGYGQSRRAPGRPFRSSCAG